MRQASVNIIKDQYGRVLLLERSGEHRHFPYEWCLPGGKRELPEEILGLSDDDYIVTEEDYIETIAVTNFRETFEETGLKCYVCRKSDAVMIDDKFECIVFVAIGLYGQPTVNFPNREHLQFGWFYPHELPEKIGKMTKILLQNEDDV